MLLFSRLGVSRCKTPKHSYSKFYSTTTQNMVEKIVQKFVIDPSVSVRAGDFVSISPAHVMTHDNSSAVISKFKSIGSGIPIKNPRQVVFTLDHNVQDKSTQNIEKYKKIQDFAEQHGIDFYPAGRGIGHQVMCEEGYAFPGTLVVASDSHSNMYGGLGCLGTPVVRTDAAGIWVTGKTWWKVPPVTKVHLLGELSPGVTGKDVIVALCGTFNQDEVLNNAVEFTGPGVSALTMDDRLTIANMSTEWGALAGVFPVDSVTLDWLKQRLASYKNRGIKHPRITYERIKKLEEEYQEHINSDKNAYYHQNITLDLTSVSPHVSGPNDVKVMNPIAAFEKNQKKINKAYIVSCVNSRLSDLRAAANVLKGKKVAEHVKLYVAAASSEVEAESKQQGDWQTLLDSGAHPLPPGCGPCIGLGTGLLEDGEVGISATNRNFKGRMGSRNAECYLASPAVVAASAVNGYITAPEGLSQEKQIVASLTKSPVEKVECKTVSLIPGFPKLISGEAVFCPRDNINTDGIYPGKYTYKEDITPEQQAEVVMENYDSNFGKLVSKGNIVIGKYNFGTGSSREQAVTALKHKGVSLLLAGSFSETYTRNAFNNGFICIEVPELVEKLSQECMGEGALTIKTGKQVEVDFASCVVRMEGREYPVSAIGPAVQELVLAGGLEGWIRLQLNKN